MGGRLTAFAVVEDAGFHDSTRAQTLCAGLTAGDVRLADRAYTDFSFLDGLRARGVFFVVRQKTNMRLKCVRRPPSTPGVKNRQPGRPRTRSPRPTTLHKRRYPPLPYPAAPSKMQLVRPIRRLCRLPPDFFSATESRDVPLMLF